MWGREQGEKGEKEKGPEKGGGGGEGMHAAHEGAAVHVTDGHARDTRKPKTRTAARQLTP